MGYSSRDNELKLVEGLLEEKKDDGGNHDELLQRRRDEKQQSTSSAGSNSPEDSNSDVAVAEVNEPFDMQLQDSEQAAINQQHQQQHQQQQQQAALLNFAAASQSSNDAEAAAIQQLQANLAAQQLIAEHAAATAQQQIQQTQLMTSSLNSLQLGVPNATAAIPSAFTGPVAMNVLSSVGVPTIAPMPPFTTGPAQQVLALQQAAAQAAALSIGAITSSQAAGVPPLLAQGATQAITPGAMIAPFGPLPNNPVALLGINPAAAVNPIAALSPTNAPVLLAPMVSTHHLSPQLTIPHYVPPIPPTWGAQTPALSVQDRPLVPPIYNGINPNYPGAQLLHAHPPIFAVNNFLSPAECDFLIEAAHDSFGPAPVVGKGSGELSSSRTSSTCYLAREDLPEYLRKVSLLTGKPAEHCELPQVGRYMPSQQYLQHFDAFDLSNEDGRRFAANGGQRTATVLVYLNDVPRGGATAFPNLNIEVQPRRGMALVFFPSTLDGLLDKMTLHAAQPAVDVKYVSQVWIRQSNYEGRPSKRLAEPMVAGMQERREAMAQKILMAHHQQQQAQVQQAQQVQAAQLHAQVAQQQQLQQQQQQQQQQQGFQQMNG